LVERSDTLGINYELRNQPLAEAIFYAYNY